MSQAEPSPLQPGTLVHERYRVTKIVGQGGLGTVYQVADILYGRGNIYALKEHWDQSASAKKQFRNEGEWLKALSHPSIPKVMETFEWSGRQYIVMEFVEGENLERKLELAGGRPLPEAQVIAWVLPICDALYYLHTSSPPIIHRDVKPSNIIVTPVGHSVLVDLGIAKEHAPGGNRTATFVRKAGTEGYAAPEQYSENGQTGPWSDVYGLGATLYHLLTTQIPPTAVDRVALDVRLRQPRELNPLVSDTTDAAIFRALAIRPQERFQSLADFERALTPPAGMMPGAHLTPGVMPGAMPGIGTGGPALTNPPAWPSAGAMPSALPSPLPATPSPVPRSFPTPAAPSPPRLGPPAGMGSTGAMPVPVRAGWSPAKTAQRPISSNPRAIKKPVRVAPPAHSEAAMRSSSPRIAEATDSAPDRSRLLAHPVLWGIGLAAVVLLLAVGIFITTQAFAPLDRSSPTSTVTSYFTALGSQNYSRAWQCMAASERGQTSEGDFTTSLRSDDAQYGRVLSARVADISQEIGGQVTVTVNVLRARTPNTPLVYTAELTQYGGQWLIDSLVTS